MKAGDIKLILASGSPRRIELLKMLQNLSGKEHLAITGVTVIDARKKIILQETATTRIKFHKINKDLIKRYFEAVNPLDKAGAYGIQGKAALLIELIKGDYFNVVGLPLNTLNQLLEKFGVSLI